MGTITINQYIIEKCLNNINIKKYVDIHNIQKVVSDYFNIKISDMISKNKTKLIVRPRQLAITFSKELTKYNLTEIGKYFGGRDHTTILHALNTIKNFLHTNTKIQNDYHNIYKKLIVYSK